VILDGNEPAAGCAHVLAECGDDESADGVLAPDLAGLGDLGIIDAVTEDPHDFRRVPVRDGAGDGIAAVLVVEDDAGLQVGLVGRGLVRGSVAGRACHRPRDLLAENPRDEVARLLDGEAARVGEDGKLFGAITPKDIEAAVKAKGVHFDRKKMHLAEPIRQTGSFEIPVKLLADVVATLKLEVVAK